jgi:hypothetical protein
MPTELVIKDVQYILNHCTKYLARDNIDERNSPLGIFAGQERAHISDSWRFPIVDSHSGVDADAYEWNDVTFVWPLIANKPEPAQVQLLTTGNTLYEPITLNRVDNSIYWSCTLKLRKGERHRYLFLVDGRPELDSINPQTQFLSNGERWSSFFTWAFNQPVSFERWEFVILDRLTRHILPFNTREAQNFVNRGFNEGNVGHLYRLDIAAGVANYIDNIVAREESHRLYAYKTSLEMIDQILRRRHPGKDPEFMPESSYVRLYEEMASASPPLFQDGWDQNKYHDPTHFLYLLRRHAITGAFSHPKYGGNPGGMSWAYLSEHYRTDDGTTAFDWRQAIEQPLGTNADYKG